MKKIKFFFLILTGFLLPLLSFSQQEQFDIVSFTAPKKFIKDDKKGVVNFTYVDKTANTFCVISIFTSTPGSGDVKKDFKNNWKELVGIPFKAIANPETETQSTDGWQTMTGASVVKMEGADVYVILTVFSGYGKTLSVRTSLNDPAYAAQLDAVLETMKLDKTKSATLSGTERSKFPETGIAGKFGMMVFATPEGWSEKVYANGISLTPRNLPSDEYLSVQILQPMNFSGNLQQALTKSYDEVAKMQKAEKMFYAGGDEFKKTEIQRSFNGWEYISGKGSIKVENGTPYKSEYGLDLFVIKINNRFERVAVLHSARNCNYSSRYFSADRQAYRNAIDNFLFSIRFTDGQAILLKPGTTVGTGITGVWQGISLQTAAATGIRYNVFVPVFLTNGQAYFGAKFPTEGLDGLDTRIPAELHRRDWGNYSFNNGKGILKMSYGDIPLRMDGDKLVITVNKTEHRFFRMPSVDGAKLNGSYVMAKVNDKIPAISFTPDGKFTDNGAVKVLYHEYLDCLNAGLLPGSGSYEIKNYSILFNYDDGRKIRIAFLGTGYDKNHQSPVLFSMSYNQDELRRQ
jgi:hypothetical protein